MVEGLKIKRVIARGGYGVPESAVAWCKPRKNRSYSGSAICIRDDSFLGKRLLLAELEDGRWAVFVDDKGPKSFKPTKLSVSCMAVFSGIHCRRTDGEIHDGVIYFPPGTFWVDGEKETAE